MSASFDVAGRLAEGAAAVDNTQTYVRACALRGYHHPDLTQHSAQVQDWFRTEDGLDLRLLDADCGVLRSVAQQAGAALECVRTQIAAMDGAWDGEGASAAMDFLRRHADSAARVTAAAETAVAAAERLRDELCRIVGDKVDTTVSIDDRTSSQRAGWLTAARAVVAGGATAEEANHVVDSEITPYVDTVIAGEWVPAMRASLDALGSVYCEAVDAVASRTGARFDIPGDLGPRPVPVTPPSAAGVSPAVVTVPAAAAPAPMAFGQPTAAMPAPLSFTEPAAATPAPTLPGEPAPPLAAPNSAIPQPDPLGAAMPPVGGMASGLPDALGGAAGLPGRFAETLGSLFDANPAVGEPPTEPALADPPELEPDEVLEDQALEDQALEDQALEDETPDEDAQEDPEGEEEAAAGEDVADGEPVVEEAATDTDTGDAPPPDCPETEVAEPPASVPPAPPADPAATPCEIAADELPQVGE